MCAGGWRWWLSWSCWGAIATQVDKAPSSSFPWMIKSFTAPSGTSVTDLAQTAWPSPWCWSRSGDLLPAWNGEARVGCPKGHGDVQRVMVGPVLELCKASPRGARRWSQPSLGANELGLLTCQNKTQLSKALANVPPVWVVLGGSGWAGRALGAQTRHLPSRCWSRHKTYFIAKWA